MPLGRPGKALGRWALTREPGDLPSRLLLSSLPDGDFRWPLWSSVSTPLVEAMKPGPRGRMTESTMRLPNTARLLAFGFAGLCAATPALAHHPMGGTLPATVAQGFLSGIGHPVIGLDHLAALVGVGLIAARFSRGLLLPGAWIAAMAVGTALHAGGVDLPFAEVLVALAVVAIGLAAARRVTLPFPVVALLFAAGGLTHGHALAEAIIGAETGPLAAYLVGLVLVQAAIATGIALAARHIAKGAPLAEPRLRFAGVAVALVGLGALALPALA